MITLHPIPAFFVEAQRFEEVGGAIRSINVEVCVSSTEAEGGVKFGSLAMGASALPGPEVLAARAWWASHKEQWPRCDDCRSR